MKKSMSTTRRLLAFLLAFALVLGYVPALDVTAVTTATAFTLEVTRTSKTTEVPAEPDTEGENAEGVTSEGEAPKTVTTYTYTASVIGGTVKFDGVNAVIVSYEWADGIDPTNTDAQEATVTATLSNGMVQTLTWSADQADPDGKVSASWTASTPELTLTAYAKYDEPSSTPTMSEGSSINETVCWRMTGFAASEDGYYYAGAQGSTVTVTYGLCPNNQQNQNNSDLLFYVEEQYTVGAIAATLPETLDLKAHTAIPSVSVIENGKDYGAYDWVCYIGGDKIEANKTYYAGDAGKLTITAKLENEDDDVKTEIAKEYTVNESDAIADFFLSHEGDKWYSEAQTVTAKIDNHSNMDQAPVGANLSNNFGSFTKDVPGTSWTATATVNNGEQKEFFITVDGETKSAKVGVDTVPPTVTIADVKYNRPQGKDGQWSVTITGTYTVGASGIASVTIAGKTFTANADGTFTASNGGTFTIDGDTFTCTFNATPPAPGGNDKPVTQRWTAVLINNAGVSNTSENQGQDVDVAYLKANIAYAPGNKAGTGADGNYYDANGTITITLYSTKPNKLSVTGADVVAKDADNNDIAVTFNNNVATISTQNGIRQLTVQPKNDSDSNNVKYGEMETFDLDIAADTTDPAVDGTNNADVQYKNAPTEYKVTITEALLESGTLTFKYADGREKTVEAKDFTMGGTYTYTIKVNNAEHLTAVDVDVTDRAGHNLNTTLTPNIKVDTEAPKVTMKMDAKVTGFYKDGTDRYFAILDKGTHSGIFTEDTYADEKLTVEMTVVIKDFSLAESSVTDAEGGWSFTTNEAGWSTMTKTFSVEVDQYTSAALDFDFTVVDLAGNSESTTPTPVQPGAEPEEGEAQTSMPVTPTAGQYKGTILVDRRAPSDPSTEINQAPNVTLKADEESTVEDRKLYNGNGDNQLVFEMNVSDLYITSYEMEADGVTFKNDADGNKIPVYSTNDAGLKLKVDTSISGGGLTTAESVNLTVDTVTGTGTAKIYITIPEKTEVNDANLIVTISDNVGNTYYYVDTFAVDNQAPRITYSYDNNSATNGTFYNAPRTATVTVEDLNWKDDTITINGTEFTGAAAEDGITRTYTVPFNEDNDYTMVITTDDLAGHNTTETPASFTVDMTAPAITVTASAAKPAASADGVHYYDQAVTYTVQISDVNLSTVAGGVNKASFTALFEDGTEVKADLAAGWTVSGETVYTANFTVEDGKVLKSINVDATDNANNPAAYEDTDIVVVDTTAPQIKVDKVIEDGGKFVQAYDGYDYYSKPITYTVTVTDNFLTKNVGKCNIVVTYGDNSKETFELAEELAEDAKLADLDTYSCTFQVTDEKYLKDISFEVADNSGNVATVITPSDTPFTKDEETGIWSYSGNPIVVDTVKPVVNMEFSSNVKSVYMNGNTVYAILNKPVESESGIFSALTGEEVTVTITVDDMNLAIDNENANGLQAKTFAWAGETPVNAKSTVTYTAKSGTVKADGTAFFEIDVAISDLAGNKPEAFDSKITTQDGTVLHVTPVEGAFAYTVSVDRLRPTSQSSDTAAPTITIEPSITPTKTADGLDLFNGAFSFAMNVTDGEKSNKNSGLASVKWTIEDGKDLVEVGELGREYAEQTFSDAFTINVPAPAVPGESNDITLTITAIDNVGNTIVFKKQFGVDTLAPRVTITQSNHSAQNDFYFNADQVVTVQIEDLNFDSTKSTVTTEVPFGGWQSLGENKYSTTLTYNTDGDYTFEMASTDLANNAATIDYTTGLVALQSFTIDKTAPVIHVNFNPFVPVDTDAAQVQYFDDVRTVTVTIDEHNFRAADVVANLGAANALGAWSSNGDSHSASEQFTQGNGYSVNVNYTDLAGNPAVAYTSPTFSVDMEAPTIVMNKGDMATGDLNIVSDDLLLGFAINDEQDNLKDFNIEVIFLSNEYQQSKVEGVEYYTVTDGDRTNGYIDFTNIESIKENDGIYTVRVSALDYAGHLVTFPDVVFSLNRFGSTFTVSDSYTSSFLTAGGSGVIYQNEVTAPLVITEINPNRVWQDAAQTTEGSAITVAANGSSVTLVAGEDYEVTVNEMGTGSNKWYEYTYTINPDVFNSNDELVDGEYTIFFYSEDEAGNKNTNESNEGSSLLLNADGNYSGKVSFNLDHKAPVVTVLNIEEGGQYVEANRNVEINISDNSPVTIAVYINDVLVEYVESAEGQPLTSDWLTYNAESGNYELNMSEKDEIQNVRVVVTDAAGNVFEQLIGDITLTENLWIQFINNEVMVIGSIVGGIGLFILIFLLLKKRKKEEEEPAEV